MTTLALDEVTTPIGAVTFAHDGTRLHALAFTDGWSQLGRVLARRRPEVELRAGDSAPRIREALSAYFGGELTAIDRIEIATGGTEFQQRVWRALRAVPAGTTVSYRDLAAAIGSPTAVRAVGAANGANPISIVVPCHRMLGTNGNLTGYAWGIERKRWLLNHEGALHRLG